MSRTETKNSRAGKWWRQYTRERVGQQEAGSEDYGSFAHVQMQRPTAGQRLRTFWQLTKFLFVALILSYKLMQFMKSAKPRQDKAL